ncbi:MAG: peptidoglycan DD-metalloendopeptidase family protein [Actinomycetota bacterium]
MRRFVVLSLVTVAVLATATVPVAAQDVALRRPVEADVLDPFRLSEGPYGQGNRGIEYATPAGAPVRAAGPGVVVFAGSVAGVVYVSIDHGGGLRSSYGPVTGVEVDVGDRVARGERLASTVGPMHFSTRVHGEYVDPATLFGVRRIEVRLIPHDADDRARYLAAAELGERHALFDLVQSQRDDGGGGFLAAIGALAGTALGIVDPDGVLDGLLAHAEILMAIAPELSQAEITQRMILGLIDVADPPPCTDETAAAAVAPPAGRRIALVVDGLDSSTAEPGIRAELELGSAGYDADDVVRFSYEGGLAPGGGAAWGSDVPRSTYRGEATHRGIEGHIDRLSDTLVQIRAANPGVPIDVYGHSLGGVVARHAIAEVDHVVGVSVAVTLASPHEGAPAATLVDALQHHETGGEIADALTVLQPDNVVLSPIVADLSERGFAGDHADVAFPDSVHAVTIGSRSDWVVPASIADAAGADHHVVVGGLDPRGAHGDIAALPAVHQEIRLALGGHHPACTGVRDRILDLVVPEAIATAEGLATALVIGDTWFH